MMRVRPSRQALDLRQDLIPRLKTNPDCQSRQLLNQRSLAVDYIDHRLQDTLEELKDPPTAFDTTLGRYVPLRMVTATAKSAADQPARPPKWARSEVIRPPQPAVDGMSFWSGIFPSAMKEFQCQRPNEPKGRAESKYGIRSLANWEDIYGVLQDAREVYDNPKGFRGGLRRGLRKVADNSQLLKGTAKLIPDFDYASPVRGTLELIANAAHRSMQIREAISRSLDDLGNSLGDIDTYLATFPGDENIVGASILLVASILKAIEDIIGYYIRNEVPKAISALFNGTEYQRSLSEALEQINITSQTLLHQARSSDMWQNRKALESTQNSYIRLGQVVDAQQRVADTQNEIKTLLEEFERKLLNERRQTYEIERLKQQNAHLDAQVNYYRVCTPSSESPYHREMSISLDNILSVLQMPEHLEELDTLHITENKGLVPSNDRARAELVLQKRQFREWVVSTASRELLIHGDFQGTRYTSGLSVLCCYLLQALGGSDRWAKLAFFCGSHIDGDHYAGGRSLIRSFISQLLRQGQCFDTSPLPGYVDLSLVERGDVRELCGLFGWLLRNMRGNSVVLFAIIDGIKYYEREEYLEDMAEVLRYLLDLTLDPSLPCVFKLLITSPCSTTVVCQAIDPEFVLSMSSIPQTARVANEARVKRETGEMAQGLVP
ncbi:hypothetical protein PG996_008173 [Apiospora saccharicola]|uniref:Nephrocystin 3-like N-terminal domain-containing protein n=1 Tax=Apiospora saccharicola TaxID=335842 RepID=A0ABR1UX46_9PEZI